MDRIKFLKFFFYLTDVDTTNGPHCFIRHSHQRKPQPLLRDGRIGDEEMQQYYPPEDIVEITGPAGSISAVDTRGFHKGKPLQKGHRLVLQLEYTTSLFGANNGQIVIPRSEVCPELNQSRTRFPFAFQNVVVQ
jgi:hypothetical protein